MQSSHSNIGRLANDLSHGSTSVYSEALERWKDTKKKLTAALQDFVEASTSLKSVYEIPPSSSKDDHIFQATLVEIDKELPSLLPLGEPLSTVQLTLAGLRNRCTKLVPISSLPSEVLGYIFTLLPSHCLHDSFSLDRNPRKYPDVLLEVSVRWCRTALATRSLWSHIDILPCGRHSTQFYSLAYESLLRANGAPLHIHITHEKPASRSQILRMVELISPFAAQYRSVELVSPQNAAWLYGAVLAGCISRNSPSSLKSLVLAARTSPRVNLANLTQESWEALFFHRSWEDLDRCLQSLHTLHLEGVYIGLSSKAYSGLTDLRFGSEQPATNTQIAALLAANPALRVLEIQALHILPTKDRFEPITLNYLKLLNVTGVNDYSLGQVLSLLAPGDNEMGVRIADRVNDSNGEFVQSFFNRSNIVTLYMDTQNASPNLLSRSLFGSLPHLRTLVLENALIAYGLVRVQLDEMSFSNITASPKLRRLCLINCCLDSSLVRHLLPVQHIKVLSILNCAFPIAMVQPGVDPVVAVVEQLKKSLLGVVDKVDMATEDPVPRWSYFRRTTPS